MLQFNDLGSKEGKFSNSGLHERALDNIWDSIEALEASISKKGTSIAARNTINYECMIRFYIKNWQNLPLNHTSCIVSIIFLKSTVTIKNETFINPRLTPLTKLQNPFQP